MPVGINPPPEAVAAYHKTKSGTMDAVYDREKAEDLVGLVNQGILSWDAVMDMATDDTTRLFLLDLASSLGRSTRSFVDDTRGPVSSHGHVVAFCHRLGAVASQQQYMHKADRMEPRCPQFTLWTRMKPLTESTSETACRFCGLWWPAI